MHDTPIICLRILLFLLFVSFMQKKCSVQQSPTFVGHLNPDAPSIYSLKCKGISVSLQVNEPSRLNCRERTQWPVSSPRGRPGSDTHRLNSVNGSGSVVRDFQAFRCRLPECSWRPEGTRTRGIDTLARWRLH